MAMTAHPDETTRQQRLMAPFIEESGSFELAPGSLPVPRLPLDGILTRLMIQSTT